MPLYNRTVSSNGPVYRFAAYTFDPSSGDLLRRGGLLRLPKQGAMILSILLERAGTVVTREELKSLLWQQDEYVEYEQAINKAMNRLRDTLRDDSTKPRFIETISKRGYRFCAIVELIRHEADVPPFGAISETTPLIFPKREEQPGLPANSQATIPDNRTNVFDSRAGKKAPRLAIALALFTCLALLFVYFHRLEKPKTVTSPLPVKIHMAIPPFEAHGEVSATAAEALRLKVADSLSQLPQLEIRGVRTLSGSRDETIHKASQDQKLQMLLLGTITLDANHIVVQLEIVRRLDAVHLASMQYEVTQQELASLPDRIQRDVLRQLQLPSPLEPTGHGSTQNPAAFEAYTEGRWLAVARTQTSLESAIDKYKTAIAMDPHFARAYAGMATAVEAQGQYHLAPVAERAETAKHFAQQAIQFDSDCAEAHAVLGFILYTNEWNAFEGEKELRRGIELDTNQAAFHIWLAVLLAQQGRKHESLEEIDHAKAVDPQWPAVYGAEMYVAEIARDTDRTHAAAMEFVRLQPASNNAHNGLAWADWNAGKYVVAIERWRAIAVKSGNTRRVAIEDAGLRAFRSGGVRGYAKVRIADILASPPPTGSQNDYVAAEWYAMSGNKMMALKELKRLCELHDPYCLAFRAIKYYDNLKDDPAYQRLLAEYAP